jgi:hypothetical protein
MKLHLQIASLLLATGLLTGCSKVIVRVGDPLEGSWVLTSAAAHDNQGWYTIHTGIENGVFTFYSDGSATYIEGNELMQGSWFEQTTLGGYYDENGNYYTDQHQSLDVNMQTASGNDNINMHFDNVRVYGNSFVATNYNNNSVDKFTFGRY